MIEENTVDTQIDFSAANIFYGISRLWQSAYGCFFLIVSDKAGTNDIMYDGIVFGTLFILWLGTFGKNKAYNTFWLYFDIIISIGWQFTHLVLPLILEGDWYLEDTSSPDDSNWTGLTADETETG